MVTHIALGNCAMWAGQASGAVPSPPFSILRGGLAFPIKSLLAPAQSRALLALAVCHRRACRRAILCGRQRSIQGGWS